LKQFPDRFAETVDSFVNQLGEATEQLVNSAGLIKTPV
jgi:hypothetical protein